MHYGAGQVNVLHFKNGLRPQARSSRRTQREYSADNDDSHHRYE